MIVKNIRLDSRIGLPAIAAEVIWENSSRPSQEIYFATLDKFAEYLTPEAASFAIGCLLPAMQHGEKRLSIHGALCPQLRDGLEVVIGYMRMWYGAEKPHIRIEADVQQKRLQAEPSRRAALFFSGGLDSLFSLRDNHLRYPPSHPAYYKIGIIIYGFNTESDNRPGTFESAVKALSQVTSDEKISLLPVYTNLRSLDNSTSFFLDMFHGAALGAVSHALSTMLHSVAISASDSIPELTFFERETFIPFGSNPSIDTNYSSFDLSIRNVGLTKGRVAKARLIAQWPIGLDNIRVCQIQYPGANCGSCEKCIRTMLELTAVGALNRSASFPIRHLTTDHLKRLKIKPKVMDDYGELVGALKECGRADLSRAVRVHMARAMGKTYGPKEWMKKIDRQYLNGNLSQLKMRMTKKAS
jgi:hypothetical protein